MIVIGEKINGTRKTIADAIRNRDSALIKELAWRQTDAGAHYLDINAGTHPDREPQDMQWLIETVQAVVDLPLCLDSANPKALEAGLRQVKRTAMINSLSGERDRIENVLPMACEHRTHLIVLALDDTGIPETTEKRIDIIARLIQMCRKGGLPDEYLYIDPLVTTIATDIQSGQIAFETMRCIRRDFPQVNITCGLSNISFGQPSRSIINQAFAAIAISCGLNSAIMDPEDMALRNIRYAAELVLGIDPHCKNYNKAHRNGIIGSHPSTDAPISHALKNLVKAMSQAGILGDFSSDNKDPARGPIHTAEEVSSPSLPGHDLEKLAEALVGMREKEVEALTHAYLSAGGDPLNLLNASRAAMGRVGELFEKNEYFVPELMLAGEMLAKIAAAVKPLLRTTEQEIKKSGKVIIGTVKGDIHDIGKDIVVTMLDINGYDVLDLGVDVPVERFVEAARKFEPQVVGLSGFLTLAYEPMKETIAAIRAAGHTGIKFMIGGGQMDDQVSNYVGADAFGKDAMEAVKLCERWIRD
jgi:cobalamin-dependent methionine synthase I